MSTNVTVDNLSSADVTEESPVVIAQTDSHSEGIAVKV